MFGYIRVLEDELKIRDFGIYRGIYCGLCKSMNKNTGITSPLTLTYDFVLLALIRSGINGEGFTVRPGKCIAHPIIKRPVAKDNEALRYCAAVSAVLTYYKLLDDKNDRDTKKRIVVKSTLRQAKRNMKKAIKSFPKYKLNELADDVQMRLNELALLEESRSDSADTCADVFGRLLAKCFSHCVEDTEKGAICNELGYRVGRWIYLIDLCDDFKKDLKTGAFNPLICAGYTELPETLLRGTLERESLLAYEALKKLNIKFSDIFSIAENILCYGMHSVIDKIFDQNATTSSKTDVITLSER